MQARQMWCVAMRSDRLVEYFEGYSPVFFHNAFLVHPEVDEVDIKAKADGCYKDDQRYVLQWCHAVSGCRGCALCAAENGSLSL